MTRTITHLAPAVILAVLSVVASCPQTQAAPQPNATAGTTAFDAGATYMLLLQEAAKTLDAYNNYDLPAAAAGADKMAEEVAKLWSQPAQIQAIVTQKYNLTPRQSHEEDKLGIYVGYAESDGILMLNFRKPDGVTVLPGHTKAGELELRFTLSTTDTVGFNTKPTVITVLKDWYSGFGHGRPEISIPKAIPNYQP